MCYNGVCKFNLPTTKPSSHQIWNECTQKLTKTDIKYFCLKFHTIGIETSAVANSNSVHI
jgi:hypothetical protein